MKEIRYYKKLNNKIPFFDWLDSLKDKKIIKKIFNRLTSISAGNFGDHKSVGNGVKELRFKNGTRIYYGEEDNIIVILLIGGNKDSQEKDIKIAREYWQEHKNRFGGK